MTIILLFFFFFRPAVGVFFIRFAVVILIFFSRDEITLTGEADPGEGHQAAEDVDRGCAKVVAIRPQLPEILQAGQLDRETAEFVAANLQALGDKYKHMHVSADRWKDIVFLPFLSYMTSMGTPMHAHKDVQMYRGADE